MDKLKERAMLREVQRLQKAGKLPSLEEVCRVVLETRREYVPKIRRARREARGKAVVN